MTTINENMWLDGKHSECLIAIACKVIKHDSNFHFLSWITRTIGVSKPIFSFEAHKLHTHTLELHVILMLSFPLCFLTRLFKLYRLMILVFFAVAVALHFLFALLSFLAPPVEIDCILWDVNTLQLSLFLSRDSLYHFVKITFKWKLCVQISG